MAAYPIIFSAPMVRALLDGRKTMTRRLAWKDARPDIAQHVDRATGVRPTPWQKRKPGDLLWVREAWATWMHAPALHDLLPALSRCPNDWAYRATDPEWAALLADRKMLRDHDDRRTDRVGNYAVKSPIHMPRWASRLTLEITDVKTERLQEISEADARAEGCELAGGWGPRVTFALLWNSLHGPGAWEANPEVVAMTFRVHRCNVDQMTSAAA